MCTAACAVALVSALNDVEHDSTLRATQQHAALVDAANMTDFAIVFIKTAAELASITEQTIVSRRHGRIDYPAMAEESAKRAKGKASPHAQNR